MTTHLLGRSDYAARHDATDEKATPGALAVAAVVIAVAAGVALLVLSNHEARQSTGTTHYMVFWLGYLLGFGALVLGGLSIRASTRRFPVFLAVLGTFTFVPKFLMSVQHPSYYDEWGHWRHVNDILATGSLTPSDAFQPIIKYFPGLGAVTAGVHEVTRLDTWHSGQIVILAAHITALLSIYGIVRCLNLSSRSAFLAAAVYAANPNFTYFDAQYGYESLALPLAITAIYLCLRAATAENRKRYWLAGCLVAIAATALTHHVSSIFLGVMLILIAGAAWLGKDRSRLRTAAIPAVAGIAIPVVWLTSFARPTLSYLSPRLHTIWTQALQEIGLRHSPHAVGTVNGGSTGPTGRSLFGGGGPPKFEEIFAVVAALLAAGVIVVALVKTWRERRDRAFVTALLPFELLGLAYVAMLPLNFLASASEVVHRSWAFSYLGVAVVAALAVDRSRGQGDGQGRFAIVSKLISAGALTAVAVPALAVLVIGNIPAGTNAEYRFSGPYEFSSDSWGVDQASINLGRWVATHLPKESGVVTDRVTGEVITGYSTARVPNLHQGLVFGIYLNPDAPPPNVRAALRSGGFDYFILDTHFFRQYPTHSWFQTYDDSGANRAALRDITANGFIHQVASVGAYRIYRISP